MASERERVVLVVAPVGGKRWAGVPFEVRLRRALKALSRGYGLRAVSVRDVETEER